MDHEVRGFSLPETLSGADPFAAPATHHTQPSSAETRPTGPDSAAVPCPCACACGNDTGKTYTEVESLSALRFLRCEPCGTALHFGPRWTARHPGSVASKGVGESDEVRQGKRSGSTVVVSKPSRSPEDEAWDRKIAADLARERRTEAIQKWQDALPERWRLPYDEGEELLPEITDRLERLDRAGTEGKGDHGTSLLCIGPFGSGKTWAAYTYARAAVDRWLLWPQEVRIGTEAEIMEPIALASPWEIAERTQALLKPRLKMLVIDDVGTLGTYKNVENRHAAFTKVINWMYEHKRALVITTNLELGEGASLDKWIGPTAYERLKHMVGPRQVFRDTNKRAELTAAWEAEYQAMKRNLQTD